MNLKKHELKTWPQEFQALWLGIKTFDIRLNDRDFDVGNIVVFQEYDPETKQHTWSFLERRIIYITDWNQKPNYIVMGLAP